MIRTFALFILVWIAVSAAIGFVRNLSGREAWNLIKTLTYGGICAIIAFVLLMALVVLF